MLGNSRVDRRNSDDCDRDPDFFYSSGPDDAMEPTIRSCAALGLSRLFQCLGLFRYADDAGHFPMATDCRARVSDERRRESLPGSAGLSTSTASGYGTRSAFSPTCAADHRRTPGCVLYLFLGHRTAILREERASLN